MKPPTHADLKAEIAALRAVTEIELKNLTARLAAVEQTQAELVRVATQGKAGLRVLLWTGGLVAAALTTLAAFWTDVSGR
jgi:hypothetical protein